jgi:pseudomonalisin
MKRLGAIALAVGMLTASCAGHGGTSAIPQVTTSQTHGPAGAGTTRTSSTAAAPTGWATTGTQALSLSNATDLGALSPTKTLTVRVGLQMRNVSQAVSLLQSHQILSADQVKSQFAPTADQATAVASYLQSQGFTNIQTDSNNMLVSADGTVAQIQKAFDTKIDSFTQNGTSVFANVAPAYVPQSLGNIVAAVLGLNDIKMIAKPLVQQCNFGVTSGTAVATPCTGNYGPSDFTKVYDAAGTPTGSQTTIAVMAEGNVSQVVSDLRYAEQQFGLPQVPVSIVQVGLSSPDTSGLLEWDLDTQSSTGIAGNVKHLYIYDTTSLTDSDVSLEFNHWMTQDVAQIGNASFGECELFPYLDGAMLVNDMVFLQAAVQGQTMFSSSGDNGSGCPVVAATGTPATGPPFVSWPATSPYVVAVGGTSLLANPDGTYLGEAAWVGSGGGVSAFEYQPYWEQGIQPASNSTTGGLGVARGVPDIAMDADPNTSDALVYAGGTLNYVGGTSLASPLSMGVYARLQSAHNNALGFAAPQLYNVYVTNPSATELNSGPPPTQLRGGFHDILSGSNGAYTALPGYDYTTGLGTFDISAMNAAIGH